MGEPKAILTSGYVCCFGVSQLGIPVAAVMAHMCPSLNIAVIDLNTDRITQWNTKQIPSREPKVEEMLKKSQNRNLIFSNNMVGAIKEAEIIIITIDCPIETRGRGKGKALSVSDIEEAARIIARESESNKIVVVKSTVPVGTNEMIRRILLANKPHNVTFQVLSVPEFFSAGNAISDLFHPERVLVGSNLTAEALEATETLASLYASWIPRNRIVTMDSKSAELAKLSQNAVVAQTLSNVGALSVICEKSGADVKQVAKCIAKTSDLWSEGVEPSLGFRGTLLKKDLTYLVHLCESLDLPEAADYWNQALLMNDYNERNFYRKILSSFFNTLVHKRIAVWGVTFRKNLEYTGNSVAFDMCLNLVGEGAKLNVCDPKMESRQLLNDLQAKGLTDLKSVTCFEDPYRAARKTDAIIVITDWEELETLDYNLIYKDMLRPAYIFDARNSLPHEELMKIGFVVKTIGTEYTSTKKFDYL